MASSGVEWFRSLPPVLGSAVNALVAVGSLPRPISDEELVAWVDGGLPPSWTWCHYELTAGHNSGVMHRIRVVGDAVVLDHHDPEQHAHEMATAELEGRHLACYAIREALLSTGPMTGVSARSRRIGEDQAKRLRNLRTVWLAYRWMQAGEDVRALDQRVLTQGPGPEDQAVRLALSTASAARSVPTRHDWAIPGADENLPHDVVEALTEIAPNTRVTRVRELVPLVERGLPPIRARCDGEMHQIQVFGEQVILQHHLAGSPDPDETETCRVLQVALSSAGPLTKSGRRAAGLPADHPGMRLSSAQAKRATNIRTAWTAYRWLKHGTPLSAIEPLLAQGLSPGHVADWVNAGIPHDRIMGWYGQADLAACQRWARVPHVTAKAAALLDLRPPGSDGTSWSGPARRALLGDTENVRPRYWVSEEELGLAVAMLHEDVVGATGTASWELQLLLARSWVTVESPDDYLTYRASLTTHGTRRLFAKLLHADLTLLTGIAEPYATSRSDLRDFWLVSRLALAFLWSRVTELRAGQAVDGGCSIDVTNEHDGTVALNNVDEVGLQRRYACRQRFTAGELHEITAYVNELVAAHGIPLTVDLRRMTISGPSQAAR